MTSKDLEKKLAGKKILWRPTFVDVSGTKQYEDLLVGDRRKGFMPDIWLRTENRMPESVIPAKILEYTAANYPANFIIEWDKDKRDQSVELNNGIYLVFSLAGDFLRIDY